MKRTFQILAAVFLLAACSQQPAPQKAIITGTVKTQGVKEVKFQYLVDNPITAITGRTSYEAAIDSTGAFSIEIPVRRLTNGRIYAGNYYHDISFMPGDQFQIKINGDSIAYSGKGAEKNKFNYQTEKDGIWDRSFYKAYNQGELTPEEFANWMQDFKQKRLDYLAAYPEKLSPEFSSFYSSQTEAIYDQLLIRYPRRYSYTAQIPVDSLVLPAIYDNYKNFSQLMDDSKTDIPEYYENIQSLIYKKVPEVLLADSTLKIPQVYQKLLIDSLSGKTQEYAIANWICNNLSHNPLDSVIYEKFLSLNPDELAAGEVQKAVDKYNAKQALIGKPLNKEFAETMVEDSTGARLTFGELLGRYKGQIVYLDLWSLNCGPCRAAMPASHEMHERIKDLPIAMVYIAQDAPSPDVWKNIFEVSEGTDNRFRMVDYEWGSSPMLKFMEISYVPCYMIFDKEGRLLDYTADRPFNVPNGISPLEKRLKELAEKV